MEFVIGSTNHAKVSAVRKVLQLHVPKFQLHAEKVPSGVNDQPFGDEETRRGAINRAKNAAGKVGGAVGIGLEGGVRMLEGQMYVCNWGALVLPDQTVFTAGGAQIPLPNEIAMELKLGKELSEAVDIYFTDRDIRHSGGAMGMFTAHAVDRDALFEHVMQLLIGQLKYANQK
ncbi:inosine/xanthosine triphosphatase [Sporosarcina luteola]|nr:inosine/xanthosine triphosphatase [Sporosarcina luteola]